MPILYILCGASGSGKSTWARNFMNDYVKSGKDIQYVSRDNIRMSIVKEEEDYFSHEKEVFKLFVYSIYDGLKNGWDTVADATHLNMFSRCKLIQALDMYIKEYEIVYVVFHTDVDTCLARNSNRSGRANVPETVIRNMCRDFRMPTKDEDDRIIDIIEVSD